MLAHNWPKAAGKTCKLQLQQLAACQGVPWVEKGVVKVGGLMVLKGGQQRELHAY